MGIWRKVNKRSVAFSLVLALLLTYTVPIAAFAGIGDAGKIKDIPTNATANSSEWQIDYQGGVTTPAGEAEDYVKIAKTISPTAVENQFQITLNVETTQLMTEITSGTAVDIVLVLDRSGSMHTCNKTPHTSTCAISYLKAAASSFTDYLLPDGEESGNQVGIVSFSDDSTVDCGLTTSSIAVKSKIGSLSPGGYTNLSAGIAAANNMISNSTSTNPKYIVVLTDGQANRPTNEKTAKEHAITAAKAAEEAGTSIFVIGCGNVGNITNTNSYAAWLKNNIVKGDGLYKGVDDAKDLEKMFGLIAKYITEILAQAWTVTDPMGEEFITMTTDFSGNASVKATQGGIVWDLKGLDDYTVSDPVDGVVKTVYLYSLTYDITLDTDHPDFVEGMIYETNKTTTLSYTFGDKKLTGNETEEQLAALLKTVDFKIPQIFGRYPTKDVKVTKKWEDNSEETRPANISIALYRQSVNESAELVGNATLSADKDWNYTFTNLKMRDDKGAHYIYSVKETVGTTDAAKYYQYQYSVEKDQYGRNLVLTNTLLGSKPLTITKKIAGENAPDGVTPYDFEVTFDKYFTLSESQLADLSGSDFKQIGSTSAEGKTTYEFTLSPEISRADVIDPNTGEVTIETTRTPDTISFDVRQGVEVTIKELTTGNFTTTFNGNPGDSKSFTMPNKAKKIYVRNNYGSNGMTIAKEIGGDGETDDSQYGFTVQFWTLSDEVTEAALEEEFLADERAAVAAARAALEELEAKATEAGIDFDEVIAADKALAAATEAYEALKDGSSNNQDFMDLINDSDAAKLELEDLQAKMKEEIDALDPDDEEYVDKKAVIEDSYAIEIVALEGEIADYKIQIDGMIDDAEAVMNKVKEDWNAYQNAGDLVADILAAEQTLTEAQSALDAKKADMGDAQSGGILKNILDKVSSFIKKLFLGEDEKKITVSGDIVEGAGKYTRDETTGTYTFNLDAGEEAVFNFHKFFADNPDANIYYEIIETDAKNADKTVISQGGEEENSNTAKGYVNESLMTDNPTITYTNIYLEKYTVTVEHKLVDKDGNFVRNIIDPAVTYLHPVKEEVKESSLKDDKYQFVSADWTIDIAGFVLNDENNDITGPMPNRDITITYYYTEVNGGGGGNDKNGGGTSKTKTTTATIPDQGVPLTDLPQDDPIIIPEDDVALADLPKTGGIAAGAIAGIGALIAALGVILRKREA